MKKHVRTKLGISFFFFPIWMSCNNSASTEQGRFSTQQAVVTSAANPNLSVSKILSIMDTSLPQSTSLTTTDLPVDPVPSIVEAAIPTTASTSERQFDIEPLLVESPLIEPHVM